MNVYQSGRPEMPDLIVAVNGSRHVVQRAAAPATIGRDYRSTIHIDHAGISGSHARLEIGTDGLWQVRDAGSLNGIFHNAQKVDVLTITDGLTIHLGHSDGIPVTFGLAPASPTSGRAAESEKSGLNERSSDSDEIVAKQPDPVLERVGALVNERRKELKKTIRDMVQDGAVSSQTTIVDLQKGRRWPHQSTRANIERYLGLEEGQLERWRAGYADTAAAPVSGPSEMGAGEAATISHSTQSSVVVAVRIALDGIRTRVNDLSPAASPGFSEQIGDLLNQLRLLEASAAEVVQSAKGPDLVLLLRDIRRTYNDLMLRAAKAPSATLGQRLYAARQLAELSAEEVAAGARVDVADIEAVEQEQPISATATNALTDFISFLEPC
ncbi:FHA domain-containing protein [Mycolicibacterium senegalense]|uniref:FHA domain-containing protein n=1 Tax=Mycobacteriaceae TaxID=1762 RepID=UPI003AAF3C48